MDDGLIFESISSTGIVKQSLNLKKKQLFTNVTCGFVAEFIYSNDL